MKQKKAIKRLISLAMALLLFAGVFLPAAYAAEEPPREIYVTEYVESIEYLGEKRPYVEMNRKREFVDWYFPTAFLFTFKDGSTQTVTVDPKVTVHETFIVTDDFEVTMPDGVVLLFAQDIMYRGGDCIWYLTQQFYTPGDPHSWTVSVGNCEGSWPPASLHERISDFFYELRQWLIQLIGKFFSIQ